MSGIVTPGQMAAGAAMKRLTDQARGAFPAFLILVADKAAPYGSAGIHGDAWAGVMEQWLTQDHAARLVVTRAVLAAWANIGQAVEQKRIEGDGHVA